MLLVSLGHSVSGISLKPKEESLFTQDNLTTYMEDNVYLDIREREALSLEVEKISPDVIVHFAAQPLVRESYLNPIGTFETNVTGTLNVLESTRKLQSLQTVLIITTDKVYKNVGKISGYTETDALGGHDPYSASKSAADIISQSWISNFSNVPIGIARAGNVIGGGDWADDRLIPDLVRSYEKSLRPVLRNPDSIRPWQHVLDCLYGYYQLINYQINTEVSDCWNFGPPKDDFYDVGTLADTFQTCWGHGALEYSKSDLVEPLETLNLVLNSDKARKAIGWSEKLNFNESVEISAHWYKSYKDIGAKKVTMGQISNYLEKL